MRGLKQDIMQRTWRHTFSVNEVNPDAGIETVQMLITLCQRPA